MSKEHREGELTLVVGKERVFQAVEAIGKAAIRRFAQTIGDYNPLYWDEQQAEKSRYGGIIAPPTLIFELGYDLGDGINMETGLQQGLEEWFDYPKGLDRAGNEYEIFEVARPDDIITAKREIIDVTVKEGKRGKRVFITTAISFSNQKGRLLGLNKEIMVCRYEEQ